MLKLSSHHIDYRDINEKKYRGVGRAALLLQSAFNYFEPKIKEGLIPQLFKKEFRRWLTTKGAIIAEDNIAFCRYGYLHPPVIDLIPLAAGEAFTLDAWLKLDGWCADMARPYCLSPVADDLSHLYQATIACNLAARRVAHQGSSFFTIVEAVQQMASNYNCFTIDEACGHGIGREFHEEPDVSFSSHGRFLFDPLKAGMVITIEPVLTLVKSRLVINGDGVAYTDTGAVALFAEAIILVGQNHSWLLSS